MANVIGYNTQPVPIKKYIKQKINMIENDFYIPMTSEEKQHMAELDTECKVDQYAHDLIMNGLKGD